MWPYLKQSVFVYQLRLDLGGTFCKKGLIGEARSAELSHINVAVVNPPNPDRQADRLVQWPFQVVETVNDLIWFQIPETYSIHVHSLTS